MGESLETGSEREYIFADVLQEVLPKYYALLNREAQLRQLRLASEVAASSVVKISRLARAASSINKVGLQEEAIVVCRAQFERLINVLWILFACKRRSLEPDDMARRYLDFKAYQTWRLHENHQAIAERISTNHHGTLEDYANILSNTAVTGRDAHERWQYKSANDWAPFGLETMCADVAMELPDFMGDSDFAEDPYFVYRFESIHAHPRSIADERLISVDDSRRVLIDRFDDSGLYANIAALRAYYGWMALGRCLGPGVEAVVATLWEQQVNERKPHNWPNPK